MSDSSRNSVAKFVDDLCDYLGSFLAKTLLVFLALMLIGGASLALQSLGMPVKVQAGLFWVVVISWFVWPRIWRIPQIKKERAEAQRRKKLYPSGGRLPG